MKTCALYIRVSTDEQTELSPDAQKRLLKEYARKNDMIVTDEYIFQDDGISGRNATKRPEFQRMIGLCKTKEHPIDVILVWKFSRFARNQEESIVYKSLLKRNNVDVISVSEPLPDGMIGTLVERIFEWMDEYYSINLAAEVTRGMTENALRGNYQGSIPIGYKYVGPKTAPEIDEEGAAIVRYIFNTFVSGGTFTQIARELNNKGYRTIRNSSWENRTVRYVLQNPFYIGKLRWNYFDRKNNTYKSKDDVIIADSKHESLIDIDTWNTVQEMLGAKIQPYKKRDTSTCKHWLSGTLVCSSCGATLSLNKKLNSFQCWKYAKGLCTTSHSVKAELAEEGLLQGLYHTVESLKLNYDVNIKIIERKKEVNEAALIQKQIDRLKIKEAKIKDAYINGIDTLDEYKENKQILLEEKERLLHDLEEVDNDNSYDNDTIKAMLLERIKDAIAVLENPESTDIEKGNAVNSVIDKVIFNRKEMSFDFYYRFFR